MKQNIEYIEILSDDFYIETKKYGILLKKGDIISLHEVNNRYYGGKIILNDTINLGKSRYREIKIKYSYITHDYYRLYNKWFKTPGMRYIDKEIIRDNKLKSLLNEITNAS